MSVKAVAITGHQAQVRAVLPQLAEDVGQVIGVVVQQVVHVAAMHNHKE